MEFNGSLDRCSASMVAGWAVFPAAPERRAELDIFCGEQFLRHVVADRFRGDLREAGRGDGHCAFHAALPEGLTERDVAALRLEVQGTGYVFRAGTRQPLSRVTPTDLYADPRPAPRRRFRRCILHIGTEKTGTTSLQAFLALNRDRLAGQGVFVPLTLAPLAGQGQLNHSRLAVAAMDDRRFRDDLRQEAGIHDLDRLLAYRRATFRAFAEEVAAAPRCCDTLLISTEHGHSRLDTDASVAHAKAFLDPFCESYQVVCYLRPQSEMAISLYGMFVLDGVTDIEKLPPVPPPADYTRHVFAKPGYFDYATLLDRWARVFGEAAMAPRIFERRTLAEGNVIDDAMRHLGLDAAEFARPATQNNNVSEFAQRFLLRFYGALGRASVSAETRARLGRFLRERFPGQGVAPSRHQVEAFMAQFAEINEAVRARWFPASPALFGDTGWKYPREAPDATMSEEEIFRFIPEFIAHYRDGPPEGLPAGQG